MRKLLVLSVLLAAFAWSQTVYGMGRVLVYKGTIKASKSIFDVNDTNNMLSTTVRAYFALNVYNVHDGSYGMVISSSTVLYNPKTKYFKVIPNVIGMDPYDPCKITMLDFSAEDPEGDITLYATGKGRLTKYSNDPAVAKDYIVPSMKGTGFVSNYDLFDPADTYSGTVSVTMTLDAKWTRQSNPGVYSNINEVTDDIVTQLTSTGGWTNWPDLTP